MTFPIAALIVLLLIIVLPTTLRRSRRHMILELLKGGPMLGRDLGGDYTLLAQMEDEGLIISFPELPDDHTGLPPRRMYKRR
jgi:hypothetical protein